MFNLSLDEFTTYNVLLSNLYGSFNIEGLRVLIADSLLKLVPYDSLAFFLVNPANNEFLNIYHYNLPEKMFEDYKNYYEKFDLYKEKVFSKKEIPPVDRASDYFDFDEWENNIHRKDFLIPNGCYYIACIQILADKSFIGEISIHRNKDKTDFSDKDMELLKSLQPHICKAFVNNLRFTESKSPVDILLFALENKEKGVLIFDKNFKILYRNDICLSILSNIKMTSFISKLEKIIIKSGSLSNKHFEVPEPSLSGTQDIDDITYAFTISKSFDDRNPLNCFYITIIEPINHVPGVTKLKLILSKKEFIIAELLSKGLTMKEISNSLLISQDTVKTHLKKIYYKTKSRSKTDLISKFF